MKGARIFLTYALALAVAVALLFDRMESWVSSRFTDAVPEALNAALGAGEALHAALGLTRAGLALDCSTSGLFEGTYKKTYRCQDAALVDAGPQSARAAETQAPARQPEQEGEQHEGAPKLAPPLNVLVVGDSLAVTLAVSMDRVFKEYDGLNMIPKGKIASGLCNPQYYNWEAALRQFLREYEPQVVVVMMGANDAKYLTLDPESSEPAALADRRRAVYEARLAKFLAAMDEKGVKSYWIGLPVMGDQDLAGRSRALNAIVSQACKASTGGRYVDTWELLAGPGGAYAQHILDASGRRVRVREGDKVHFSTAGGDILVRAFLKDAGEAIELRPREHRQVAQAPGAPASAAP